MTAKIGVNGRCFTRRITGVERYAHEVSKRMEPSPRVIVPKKILGQISGHLWEQFILPIQVHNTEILWSPANAGPWTISNQVISIHDASVFDHPEWFSPSFAAWTRLSWRILSKRVKAVITVSEFSRERLMYHLSISENKIHVIPHGVGKPFEPQTEGRINEVRTRYNLNKPYFLFVGTPQPRKNLTRLIEAFEKLNTATHILAVAGEKGKVFSEFPIKAANLPGLQFLGYVPDPDLPALYSGSSATLTTSLYEGSALTALEAMACGAPVIASNTTSFPEVAGDATLLVDPLNPNELTEALKNIVEDGSLANALRERGFQRAAQFTWDNTARQTQSLLEHLA